jgi:3-hydroxyacyl-CoA dehydrogenase
MMSEFRKVACIGVGLIGHGWATLFAWKGYHVNIMDSRKVAVKQALLGIKSNLELLQEEGLLGKQSLDDCFDRIKVLDSIKEAVSDVNYVQESVYESYKVKKEVFKSIDKFAPQEAVLASSSSTLKITNIQKVTRNPERCVLVHPWNPTHLMPLIEVVPGRMTSKETVRVAKEFMMSLGKVAIVQKKEVNGTVGNRLAAALWREAIDLVYRGVADLEDIDNAVLAGPGIRWAVIGPHLSYHLGGGLGGIEYYLDHIGPTMEARWRTLADWTSIPQLAKKRLIKGIKEMAMVQEKPVGDIAKWRNKRLLKLLIALYYDGKR